MKEVVLFNKKGKEIDWYDPVEDEPVIKNGFLIVDNGIYEYEIDEDRFYRYEWREKREDK